jgi:hypothetical protein
MTPDIRWRYRDRWHCSEKGEHMEHNPSRNGSAADLTAGQKALNGLRLWRQGMTLAAAAAESGGPERSIESVKGVLDRMPHLEDALADGTITLNAAQVQAGYRVKHNPIGQRFYGKGDKWVEVIRPLKQYLDGWATRDYKFTHIPPREAGKRVELIDEMIAGLTKTREDLARRAHRAQLSLRD